MKSVEQKLFEAWSQGRSCRLTAEDVQELVTFDNAIRTRITNEAYREAGIDIHTGDTGDGTLDHVSESWAAFKRRIKQ